MLVKIDAAQLEWRTAVWLSGDKVGIDEILSKADIHEGNRQTFNLPTRLIAKTYLFRTIFRGSGYSFAKDPNFSHVSKDPDYWDDVNSKFYAKYKGLDEWHKQLAKLVAARKPIVSPTGRYWMIEPLPDGKLPWTVFTNYPVQGTGADIMKVARISLSSRLKKSSMKALLVSTVHDDLKLDVPDSEVDAVVKMAYSVFDDIPKNFKRLFNVDMPIPFPGEVSVGYELADKWKDLPDGTKILVNPRGMEKV